VARQRLGALPQAAESGRAAGLGDESHEALTLAVLLELDVHPGEAHDGALERRAARVATLVEAGADSLDSGDQVPTDLVHHIVAEPFEQAHHRLRFPEEAALLVVHQPFDPVLRAILVGLAANRPAKAS
jgi:hypothetical protein